jgi:stage II sporulation protein AA (anti-sigma F factor antagonist)
MSIQPVGRPAPLLGVEVHTRDGETVLALAGELDLETMPAAAQHLPEVMEHQPRRVVFDLRELSFMDSSGLRVIVLAYRQLAAGSRLVIRAPNELIRRMLEITGLDQVWEIEAG